MCGAQFVVRGDCGQRQTQRRHTSGAGRHRKARSAGRVHSGQVGELKNIKPFLLGCIFIKKKISSFYQKNRQIYMGKSKNFANFHSRRFKSTKIQKI